MTCSIRVTFSSLCLPGLIWFLSMESSISPKGPSPSTLCLCIHLPSPFLYFVLEAQQREQDRDLQAGTMTTNAPNTSQPEPLEQRPLFGGAMQISLPARMLDVSDFRPVPDHQEASTTRVIQSTRAVDRSCISYSHHACIMLSASTCTTCCRCLQTAALINHSLWRLWWVLIPLCYCSGC